MGVVIVALSASAARLAHENMLYAESSPTPQTSSRAVAHVEATLQRAAYAPLDKEMHNRIIVHVVHAPCGSYQRQLAVVSYTRAKFKQKC